ncbi:N [Cananeia virus]|uniref:Nucleoprotein n=2 Tax=Orthobunyavirus bertiogaense TaxID=3052374 RepID=A0A7D9MVY5_9VIRU|nr:N [Bertioga virus] [Bertioga virus]QLA47073.1 N [Cananeia virus] [Cananeia virus]QLA47079.1 N [Bertioga virus] [Bertioga virus]
MASSLGDIPLLEFEEEDFSAGRNAFVPDDAYAVFVNENSAQLTVDNIRIFFLRAYDAKQKLKKTEARAATLKFGTMKLVIMNNHNPAYTSSRLQPTDLTLHRVSGYLARFLKECITGNVAARIEIHKKIINPIAESVGITWENGDDVYLSFFPGAEMFLEKFKLLPLAIGIYRVQQKHMDADFLKKHLRQQYGDIPASQWMLTMKEDVKSALTLISKLPWGKAGMSAAARAFLADFGIRM